MKANRGLIVRLLSFGLLLSLVPAQSFERDKSEAPFYRAAITQNEQLKTSLSWTFGGKAQRGWGLYLPLIASLLQTESPSESREFVDALTRWQRRAGLAESGLLDQETWLKMVEYWQTRRNSGRQLASPESLLTVEAAVFYDSERPAELRMVERQTYQAYLRMREAAARELTSEGEEAFWLPRAGDNYLKIISAFRSPAYQQKLRSLSPNAGRAGLAINSPHFTGRTLDLYVGGDPVSTKDENRALQMKTPAYRWLVKNAGRFGFIPYFYEPWHWEYNPQAAN